MTKQLIFRTLICLTLLASACSDSNLTPEDEVRAFIANGVEAAENRKHSDLAELIHPSYNDQKGYDKNQLGQLLRAYFFRHKNIFLLTKIREINILVGNEATVLLHVAMAGSVISDASALANLRAQVYRFELQLVKQDDWMLRDAKWRRASMGDMQ